MRKIIVLLLVLTINMYFQGTIYAGYTEQEKLTASDGAASDYFGYSVSISGDYAITGAYLDDDNGSGSGSAYIFSSGSTANAPFFGCNF